MVAHHQGGQSQGGVAIRLLLVRFLAFVVVGIIGVRPRIVARMSAPISAFTRMRGCEIRGRWSPHVAMSR